MEIAFKNIFQTLQSSLQLKLFIHDHRYSNMILFYPILLNLFRPIQCTCYYSDFKGQITDALPKSELNRVDNVDLCFQEACGRRICESDNCVALFSEEKRTCYRYVDGLKATISFRNGNFENGNNVTLIQQSEIL